MNRKELATQAFLECCNPDNIIRSGKRGTAPFWNIESKQFMYIPSFYFTGIPNCSKYRYDAVDESGTIHSFVAEDCDVALTPIWAKLPEGVVRLTVTAVNPDGSDYALVGARTFFKLASFPESTPEAKCSYAECVEKAYHFIMSQSFVQHWLKYSKPDPAYDLNTYPSKMVSALVEAMINFSKLYPEAKEDSMKIAVNAADWLMDITPRGNHPLADIPPTYYLDFCPDAEKYGIVTPNYEKALLYQGTVMMIYPAAAGSMYLHMAAETGEKKYFDEALKIGNYYLNHVENNGSWYLVRSEATGEPIANNFVAPMEIVVPFLTGLYEYTGDKVWKDLFEGAIKYVEETQWIDYNWEGQFEDIGVSSRYYNLTQYGPVALAKYYLKYQRNELEYIEAAKELMRFAEDQFIIWNREMPWRIPSESSLESDETSPKWHTPSALEQYHCYVPIDGSVSHIASGFLSMYEAGCGEIYLAKTRALADQITRMQYENGKIPTFWIDSPQDRSNFWLNCMFSSCDILIKLSKYEHIKFE